MGIEKKRVLSWILIFAIIFTGINWPSFASFADKNANSELLVDSFEVDYSLPYIMLVAKKDAGDSSIYAIRSSHQLYYMPDYKLVTTSILDEATSVYTKYYKWDETSGWMDETLFETKFYSTFGRFVTFYNTSTEVSYSQANENQFDIVKEVDLTQEYLNNLNVGNYILGVGSINENKTLLSTNYLEYKDIANVWSMTGANLFNIGTYLSSDEIYKNLKVIKNGEESQTVFDYQDIGLGDTIVGLPEYISKSFMDSFTPNGNQSNLNISYEITSATIFKKNIDRSDLITTNTFNSLSSTDKQSYTPIIIYVKKDTSDFILEDAYKALSQTEKDKYVPSINYVETNYISKEEWSALSDDAKNEYEVCSVYVKATLDENGNVVIKNIMYQRDEYKTADATSESEGYTTYPTTDEDIYSLYHDGLEIFYKSSELNEVDKQNDYEAKVVYQIKDENGNFPDLADENGNVITANLVAQDVATGAGDGNYREITIFTNEKISGTKQITNEAFMELIRYEKLNRENLVVRNTLITVDEYNDITDTLIKKDYKETTIEKKYIYDYSYYAKDGYEKMDAYKKATNNIINSDAYYALEDNSKYEPITCYYKADVDLTNFGNIVFFEDYNATTHKDYISTKIYAKYSRTNLNSIIATASDTGDLNLSNYATYSNGTLTIKNSKIDGGTIPFGNENFLLKIRATFSSLSGTYGYSKDFYIHINEDGLAMVDEEFNKVKETSLHTNINKITEFGSNSTTSTFEIYGQNDKSTSFNNRPSKEINNFEIYTLLDNNFFDNVSINTLNNSIEKQSISYTVKSIDYVNIDSINLKDYIEFVWNDSDGCTNVYFDADKITEYRRDNRNNLAFQNIEIEANYNGNKSTINIELTVMQYLNNNFVTEGTNMDVANVEFQNALPSGYAPLVTELKGESKGLQFVSATKFLVDYSDYQLLFYTNSVPFLDIDENGNEYLSFMDNEVDIEIYKNNNGMWQFFNFMTNVKDAKINLPETYGHKAIQFCSVNLVGKSNITQVYVEACKVDTNNNMTLVLPTLPGFYYDSDTGIVRNEDTDNVFKAKNYYYLFRKGQSTFFLVSTNTPVSMSDASDYVQYNFSDTDVYTLMGNYWVEYKPFDGNNYSNYVSSGEEYFMPKIKKDFNDYLISTNDAVFVDKNKTVEIGSMGFYARIPRLASTPGMNLLVSQSKDYGFVALEYSNSMRLVIDKGNIKFENTTGGKITVKYFTNNAWGDSEIVTLHHNNYISPTLSSAILGSVLYTSVDITDVNGSNVLLKDVGMSHINVSTETTTFDFKRPSVSNTTNLTEEVINKTTYDGELYENFFLTKDNQVYLFNTDANGKLLYDYELVYTGQEDADNIFISKEGDEGLEYSILQLVPETGTWEYIDTRTLTGDEESDNIYFFKRKNIEYTSFKIPTSEERYDDLSITVDTSVTFKDELVSNEFVEYTDPEGKTYKFINGAYLTEDDEACYQMLDDNSNYWIFVSDSINNIWNPVENGNAAYMAEDSTNFKLYLPVFDEGFELINGSFEYTGEQNEITSYVNGKTNIMLKGGSFYSGVLTEDTKKPVIQTIYDLTGKIYVYAYDEDDYQTMYDEDGNILILFDNNKVYQSLSYLSDYNKLPEDSRLHKDGVYYRLLASNEAGNYTTDGTYLYYYGEKVVKTKYENGKEISFEASGVKNTYVRLLRNTIFYDAVTIYSPTTGETSLVAAGKTVPSNSVVIVPNNGLPTIENITETMLEFYCVDGVGNVSDTVKYNPNDAASPYKINSVLWGTPTQDILDMIEYAQNNVVYDDVAPEIKVVYILNGTLYIRFQDKAPIGGTPILFDNSNWITRFKYTEFLNEDDLLLEDIEIINEDGTTSFVEASRQYHLGDLLAGSSLAWQGQIGDGLNINKKGNDLPLIKTLENEIQEGSIDIIVRDANRNESEVLTVTVSQEKNNTIIYGANNVDADDELWDILNKAQNGETPEDSLNGIPIIKAIYVLNGILYVEATDDTGIDDFGWNFRLKTTMPEDWTGAAVFLDSFGEADKTKDEAYANPTYFAKGSSIKANTTLYSLENYMPITIPNAMTVYVYDIDGNVVSRNIYPTEQNQVLFGTVSDTIKDLIESSGGTTDIPDLNTYPEITAVYTYEGYLYFTGTAVDGFSPYPYGFRVEEDSIYPGVWEGYDELGRHLSMAAGRVISKGSKIYKEVNYQRIAFPTEITVIIRDVNGDEAEMTFTIDKDNWFYYGDSNNIDETHKPGVEVDPDIDNPSGDDEDGPGGDTPGEGGDTPGGDDPSNPGGDSGEGGGTPGGDDPSNPDDGDNGNGGIGDGDVVPGNPGNVTPETEENPGIIVPDEEETKDFDWNEYDYVLELYTVNSDRLVYRIRKDKVETIEMPRLEDSTTYIYRQRIVNEATNIVEKTIEGLYETFDSLCPVISKIWFSKNRLYVTAYDQGGLATEPYLFAINGAITTNTTYSQSNNIRAVYGDNVSITVKDKAGNTQTVTIEIKPTTDNVLYQCVNASSPILIKTGTKKSVSYWLAFLSTNYGIDTKGLEINKANCSNISFNEVDKEVLFDFDNDGVLTYYNKENNMYYALNLRTLNAGKAFRSILVQTGSEVDFVLAFEKKIIETFKTVDGITWAVDESGVIDRDVSMIYANNPGVAKIVASKGDIRENFYVVVTDKISTTNSTCDFSNENFSYTYLVNDKIDIAKALSIPESLVPYIVLDNASDGIVREGNFLKATNPSRKTILLLDTINDKLFEYKFEAVYVTPFISNFSDIVGAENRVDIEFLCERGTISVYPDLKYKSANKMTTKEFLTMLNRVRLSYDSNYDIDKQDKVINLDDRDFDYYSSLNILSNFSQEEIDTMLGEYTLNKAISFEEAVSLISTTLLYNEHHTITGVETPEGLENVSDAAKHLITLGVISEDDARNGSREITKSEIAYMVAQTIRFLEY